MIVPFGWFDIDAADLVAWINMYVLPPVVLAVVWAAFWRDRHAPIDARLERARAVRLIGLCHYGQALRAVLMIVPEWVVFRETGAFASLIIVNVLWPVLIALSSVPIGLGLRRRQPWARWGAVALNGFLAMVGMLVVWWRIGYGAAVYAWDWPDIAVARILPFFVLVVLLAPGSARVFWAEESANLQRESPRVRPSLFSLVALGFLVVLTAIVVVNAVDWLLRYVLFAGGADF